MSEVIDRIPGVQSAMAVLRGVVETTAQLKARQRITGRSGQLGYTVESDDEWDLTMALSTTPPAYLTKEFLVTYTGDGSQDYPIAVPSTDLRFNGVDEANRPTITPSNGQLRYTDANCDVIVQRFDQPEQSLFGSVTQSAWRIVLLYQGNVTVRIKARASATCDGAVSVVGV